MNPSCPALTFGPNQEAGLAFLARPLLHEHPLPGLQRVGVARRDLLLSLEMSAFPETAAAAGLAFSLIERRKFDVETLAVQVPPYGRHFSRTASCLIYIFQYDLLSSKIKATQN